MLPALRAEPHQTFLSTNRYKHVVLAPFSVKQQLLSFFLSLSLSTADDVVSISYRARYLKLSEARIVYP